MRISGSGPDRDGRHGLAGIGLARPRPTHGIVVGDGPIAVASGRDYGDVSPVDGIILVSGPQGIRVEVDVVPDDETAA